MICRAYRGFGRYNGLLKGDNYLQQANLNDVENRTGRLLLVHGGLDHSVHPAGVFQLAQAHIEANTDFDMVIMPRAGHELPGYSLKRIWDYFATHLEGPCSADGLLSLVSGRLPA